MEALDRLISEGFSCGIFADVNNTSAVWDALRWASKQGFPLAAGVDFKKGILTQYVALPNNPEGFREVNAWLSHHLHEGIPVPDRAPHWEHVTVIYPFDHLRDWEVDMLLPYEWVGIAAHEVNKWRVSRWHNYAQSMALPVLSFRHKRDFNLHRLLRAIEKNTLLSKVGMLDVAERLEYWHPRATLEEAYALYPELWIQAEELIHQQSKGFHWPEEVGFNNQSVYASSMEEDGNLIEKLALEGMAYRYPDVDPQDNEHPVLVRLHKELEVIKEKNYVSYFLINWDITSYARSKGYFYVGRGSGANSIVAYLLRITDVDPIELDLYFERFINLYRQNPPDFDMDFSWTDREDITRYIFSRFPHVTLLGAYNTFQYRAAVRELGKVFGLPKDEIDMLSDGKFRMEDIDEIQGYVLRYAQLLQDFPNQLAIHAAGIIISQRSIHYYTSTFLPPKGFPTTHFDMVVAEDIGLYKFDILSQRGLGKIKECVEIVAYNQPGKANFDVHDIPRFKQDPNVKALIQQADAIGCFYVESPAMRMLLTKLRVNDYLGLVAASSVIRPGVAKSGMMREFILRQRDPERRKQAHPVLYELMPETYGVMVYQEDVIKVAHFFAGLSLGEADALRRGMSGKFRGRAEFDQARDAFVEKALAKGHPLEEVLEIWRQVESFAGYAFAKGHSASYAVESFQSLFLKAYFPLEYMVATINNGGGFYSTEFYVHEARRKGATIEAPCLNLSSAQSVIYDKTIYLGLGLIKSLEHPVIERILKARKEGGPFESFEHVLDRVHMGVEQCTLLIRVGAFRSFGVPKKEMLWYTYLFYSQGKRGGHATLFQVERKKFKLPPLHHHWLEDVYDHIELLGFPLCSPFQLLPSGITLGTLAREVRKRIGQEVTVTGYFITYKSTRTAQGQRMYFGNFLDQEGEFLDTVHFPSAGVQNMEWWGQGIYELTGKVTEEFDSINIEVYRMRKWEYMEDPRTEDLRAGEKLRLSKGKISKLPPKADYEF